MRPRRHPAPWPAPGLIVLLVAAGTAPAASPDEAAPAAAEAGPIAHRAAVPGTLVLQARSRQEVAPGQIEVVEEELRWPVAETAIIVCDMWDDHWCAGAARRVGVMAPRMNAVLEAARSRGVLVLHAPSETMDAYEGTVQRRRLQQAPAAEPPVPIAPWCRLDPDDEGSLPIDDADGGCDCTPACPQRKAWTRQHPALAIAAQDGISDSGQEIYNYLTDQGVKNVVLMGVHTNMCVLGRSFGIRQLTRLGFNVALARDLTDAMYNPRSAPYVSHARGTELVIEHVERYWCPSILGADLTRVEPGSDGP